MSKHNDIEHPRRRFLETMLAAGMYSLSSGILIPDQSLAMGKIPTKLVNGKSIYDLSGEVTVDGKNATASTLIKPNSVLTTGDDSHLIFAVGKDAFIMRENSRLEISGNDFVVNTLNLLKGKLLSVFGKSRHNIRTPTVTVGIRGTGIYVEAEPELSYICTCYGTVELTSTTDPLSRETITATHHDDPKYIHAEGRTGKKIEPGPFINHTDLELMLIEELVGRSLPFMPGDAYDGPRRSY
ncbi:MAG: FecR domain-containing protein [Gammaproteobacteria bacterium]|nr:FecR domain-containing protein [Gammaproteobacteria bacterium]